MTLMLLFTAIGFITVALLFLAWRRIDRHINNAYADQDIEVVKRQLDEALTQHEHLTTRVEHLEAIIAGEPWHDAQTRRALPLPNEEAKTPPPAERARRNRNR